MELKEIKLKAAITPEGTIFIQDKDGGFSCGYGSLARLYNLIITKIESVEDEEPEKIIELITERIKSEHRKHKDLEWEKIAAHKIYSTIKKM